MTETGASAGSLPGVNRNYDPIIFYSDFAHFRAIFIYFALFLDIFRSQRGSKQSRSTFNILPFFRDATLHHMLLKTIFQTHVNWRGTVCFHAIRDYWIQLVMAHWRTLGGWQVRAPKKENFFFELPKFEKKFGKFM